MARLTLALSAVLIAFTVAGVQSQRPPAGTSHQGKAYRFNKVADGVYHAVGTGALAVALIAVARIYDVIDRAGGHD